MAFAKKQHLEPELVELNALVEGMVDLVEISLKPDVVFHVSYADQPIHVLIDPGQLESSLLNLVLNANQAIKGPGHISLTIISTDHKSAHVLIEDSGAGMSADVLGRVMEPFYTTRSKEGGTGLGLSIAYGFIRQSGGDLKIYSEVGLGTQIEITLLTPADLKVIKQVYDGKSVLLVEDNPETIIHTQKMLEALGFKATAVVDGSAATLQLTHFRFDVIVTDLDLGMSINGWDLVDQFLDAYPENHAVVVSGRLPDLLPKSSHTSDRIHCLPKPLTIESLNDTLSKIYERAVP